MVTLTGNDCDTGGGLGRVIGGAAVGGSDVKGGSVEELVGMGESGFVVGESTGNVVVFVVLVVMVVFVGPVVLDVCAMTTGIQESKNRYRTFMFPICRFLQINSANLLLLR
jgi:hypothetical protein